MSTKTGNFKHPTSSKSTTESNPSTTLMVTESSHDGHPVGEDAIRLRAYRKWEEMGKPDGDGVQFWLEAERELSQVK